MGSALWRESPCADKVYQVTGGSLTEVGKVNNLNRNLAVLSLMGLLCGCTSTTSVDRAADEAQLNQMTYYENELANSFRAREAKLEEYRAKIASQENLYGNMLKESGGKVSKEVSQKFVHHFEEHDLDEKLIKTVWGMAERFAAHLGKAKGPS